jgi:hypothetical protein
MMCFKKTAASVVLPFYISLRMAKKKHGRKHKPTRQQQQFEIFVVANN